MTILKPIVIDAVNLRIKNEEASARLYRSMSNWFAFNGYAGAAKLFAKYADEEMMHMQKAYDYLQDQNVLPETPSQDMPAFTTGFKAMLEGANAHEIDITNQCQALAKLANDEGDFMTFGLAQWYCNEQVEELAKTQYWLDRITAFGVGQLSFRMIDAEMMEAAEA
jgi:ferritin